MGSLHPGGRSDGSSLTIDDLNELQASVKGKIVLKNASPAQEYEAAIDRWAESSIRRANIVVFVEDEDDVSNSIKFVTNHNLDVAIAGGRHSYHGASSANGLVIDLQKMNAVKIDKKAKTVTAQGGCKAEDLEVPLEREGLSVVMGHANDTGIGGLTTGGGSGWLTGQYGYIVDNLLAARVALADGRVVNASETENSDLFWGIRGGGSNFGICTEFTYQAHDQAEVYFGFLIYPPEKLHPSVEVVPQIYESICASKGKFQAFFGMTCFPGSTWLISLWTIFYDGPASEAHEYLKPLHQLGPSADMTKVTNYASCNAAHKQVHPLEGYKRHSTSAAQLNVPIDVDIVRKACDSYKVLMEKYGTVTTPSLFLIELQSSHVSKSVPVEKMAYANRHEAISVSIDLKYDDPSLDELMRQESMAFAGAIRSMGREKRKGLRAIKEKFPPGSDDKAHDTNQVLVHANYSAGKENMVGVFGNNLDRLRVLKKKYDPGCVWDKWYCISPATD